MAKKNPQASGKTFLTFKATNVFAISTFARVEKYLSPFPYWKPYVHTLYHFYKPLEKNKASFCQWLAYLGKKYFNCFFPIFETSFFTKDNMFAERPALKFKLAQETTTTLIIIHICMQTSNA